MTIFNLQGNSAQNAIVQAAIDRLNFPWELLVPGLKQAGLTQIRIIWRNLGSGTLGMASTDGTLIISNQISGEQAQETFMLEVGHHVDFWYLTDAMHDAIYKAWHPVADRHQWFGSTAYWSQVGEAFSALFPWMFADQAAWKDYGYTHKPSKELADVVRKIILPNVSPPPPPVPPQLSGSLYVENGNIIRGELGFGGFTYVMSPDGTTPSGAPKFKAVPLAQ